MQAFARDDEAAARGEGLGTIRDSIGEAQNAWKAVLYTRSRTPTFSADCIAPSLSVPTAAAFCRCQLRRPLVPLPSESSLRLRTVLLRRRVHL